MLTALAPALLQGGLSLMSGIGARNSTAKQGRLQMMEDARVDYLNQDRMAAINAKREALGRELLTIEEYEENYSENTSDEDSVSEGYVNVNAMMAGAEAAGFNPATWLAAGALSAYSGRTTSTRTRSTSFNSVTRRGHNAAAAYKLMMPDMYATNATSIPKVPDMLEILGNAGTAGLNTYNQLTKQSGQQNQQNDIIRALSGLVGGGSSGGGGGISYVPGLMGAIAGIKSAGTGAPTTNGGAASSDKGLTLPTLVGAPSPTGWEYKMPEVINPWFSASVYQTRANAEAGSDRYGDGMEEVFGVRNLIADGYLNATGRRIDNDTFNESVRFGANPWFMPGVAAGLAGLQYFRPGLTGGASVNWPTPRYNYDAWTPRASSSSAP